MQTQLEYDIYIQLKGIPRDELTTAESNILKILGMFKFDENGEVI